MINKKIYISTLTLLFAVMFLFIFKSEPVNASSNTVKLESSSRQIKKGKSFQIKVIGKKKKVTYKTNNKSVATVNSKGKVKGTGCGFAIITVKADKATLKCYVAVTGKKGNSSYVYGDTFFVDKSVQKYLKKIKAQITTYGTYKNEIFIKMSKGQQKKALKHIQDQFNKNITKYQKLKSIDSIKANKNMTEINIKVDPKILTDIDSHIISLDLSHKAIQYQILAGKTLVVNTKYSVPKSERAGVKIKFINKNTGKVFDTTTY